MTQATQWDNPLLNTANPLLNAISQIRQSATHADPAQLRLQLIDELRRFEVGAQRKNLAYEIIIGARYCLCTALDEAAALTPWGSNSVWSGSGLLVTFHNETWGGEKFFQLLAKLSQNPREHIQLLELINYCLLLGFEGRYRVIENGRSQLETIKQRLLQLIRSVRGGYSATLSPNALDLPVLQKQWRPLVPLWACATMAGLLASLLFIALNWRLDDAMSPVLASIYQANLPQITISNPAPASPPLLDLKGFLRKEIAEGLVSVRDEAQQSVVILKGDGLFDSAATTLRPSYLPLIERIARAMNGVSGKILVTGYSDNVPIRSARFASNWELSLARAESITLQLQKYLDDPQRIKTEGRGESNPIAANNSKENRALNRRVEIILLVAPGNTQAELNRLQQGSGQ
ncbi:TPA: DotU family type VI secretion system protein [Serratia fonticola]|uniref:Chemotaxis protein MotB n=1 Tax=Serratia fonticola TaxID=47917 RepID=A0A3S4WZZ7_SERFO|nr:DotU family type VI secretion system protein [Serratia fonticola]MBL5862517.1 DotU family type VI secretion system protein [Serratia fonticola]CAI0701403.1 Chemotaxis protein MotB [Serratia fonticola]VEI68172.1 Chemotaxis protein MotB [Serratia fonticola]